MKKEKDKELNIYKFKFNFWTESYNFELTHSNIFSRKDLEKMQEETLKAIECNQNRLRQLICENSDNPKYDKYYEELLLSNSEVVSKVKEIFIEKYGFEDIKYKSVLITSMYETEKWHGRFFEPNTKI